MSPKLRQWRRGFAPIWTLLNIGNDLVNQHIGWVNRKLETQPKDRQQADAESATTVAMRDAALGPFHGYERLLRKVDEAIQRIKDGRYGICELTGQPIGSGDWR
jgi:RNA polymerase-binding transcription factor DksA